jgi:hypothetical protein
MAKYVPIKERWKAWRDPAKTDEEKKVYQDTLKKERLKSLKIKAKKDARKQIIKPKSTSLSKRFQRAGKTVNKFGDALVGDDFKKKKSKTRKKKSADWSFDLEL